MSTDTNNWNEYSHLVLKELETLAIAISELRSDIQDIRKDIALIQDREDKVEKLQQWKDKISEVVSPSQLLDMSKEVKDLKEFKTRSITIFLVVQAIVGAILALIKYVPQ